MSRSAPTAEAQDAAAAIIAPVDGVESTDSVARPAAAEPIAPVDPTEPITTVGGAPV